MLSCQIIHLRQEQTHLAEFGIYPNGLMSTFTLNNNI